MGLGKTGTAVSGPEFFGFAMPEVAACIEGLPGGENCKSYICRCLRLDTNRKGKSKRLNRRSAPANMNFIEEEELGERPSKRRAAERANQRWLQINDDESSASFSEEDVESDIEVEDDDDSRTSRRKNKKRAAPSTQESEPEAKKNDLYSLPVENSEIKTEQLL